MMSSLDVKLEQVKELKIKLKKWERKFESENGRKPNRLDIWDASHEIRESYIIYWKMIKTLKKQDPNLTLETGKLMISLLND